MSAVSVYAEASFEIDVDDYIKDASDFALQKELDRRIARGTLKVSSNLTTPEPWTRQGLAEDIRLCFYSRNASRFEALLRVLELREEVSA